MPELFARVDIWVIVLYMAGMLWVAWRVSATSRDVEGYTVGNRRMAGWVVGLSVLGTFTSSITFLGLPAKTYKDGNWNGYVFSLSLPVAAWIAVRYFVPLYRHGVKLSAYELLEQRFGYWARLYADLSYIALHIGRIAIVMLLVSLAVSPLLDWPIVPTLIGLGLLVIVYDVLGGIQAVIWTDVLQVIILVGGAGWCAAELLAASPGGPISFFRELPAERFSLGTWASWDLTQSTVLVVLLYGITENLRNFGTDQNYVQRLLAARNDRHAAQSIWIGALCYLPISLMFCVIGTALAVNYPLDQLPEGMTADQVFPYFIKNELPPVVTGVVIAAILAAAMSTVDSSLNSMSTIFLVDVVRRLRRGKSRVRDITILRSSTAAFGVLSTLAAVLLYRLLQDDSATIMDLWWQYAGITGGGMFGLFLLAWLLPRIPSWGAVVGVLATIPMLVWGTFFRELPPDSAWAAYSCPLNRNLVGISATLALLATAACVYLAMRAGLVRPNRRSAPGS